MLVHFAGIMVVVAPAALLAVLGLATLFRVTLSERSVAKFAQASSAIGLIAALAILSYMLATNIRHVSLELGDWVSLEDATDQSETVPHPSHSQTSSSRTENVSETGAASEQVEPVLEGHFHFLLKFVFDRLSIPFAIMSFVLCGVIGAFAFRYLHLEEGYFRFFLFYSIFQLGMIVSSLAGTIETLFFGWELVGLSSALLVAFFHDRPAPVQNGLRVWSVYRIADAAFLIAALTLHHMSGSGDFDGLMGKGDWPGGHATITENQALLVGSLLLIAAAGKSALVPFSGWLPRAMEGPTPSSAVFYGALSVHLGAFLLLRVSPVLELSPILCGMVVALGFITMVFAAMAVRVQADVKSALSYASLVQVSIIVMEIGLGGLGFISFYIPLIHIIGHACVRTLQLVRAPSLLKDYSILENALGDRLPDTHSYWARRLQPKMRARFYRFAWERGYLDSILDDYCVRPFVKIFRWSDRMERRWTEFLSGTSGTEATTASEQSEGS
ncbi:MAG TPA: proton-conducting transporter membrane subunit [Planctomycetaceae bacterium]|nr:proton-conducting transporter membrane subunit [Planctomycetaceae bacterium]